MKPKSISLVILFLNCLKNIFELMNPYPLKRFSIILCFLILNLIGYFQSYNGTIIRVIDGDTFVFQTSEGALAFRMFGADVPERNQPYSKELEEYLKHHQNKEATLKAIEVDRYGRTLEILYIDGQVINLFSLKNGCAWHLKRYSSDQQYATSEEYVQKNKLGV